ncbi:hypothetical protein ABI_45880 [Asticcacaulis biprosthecium C19]|uniref:Uncharacterized protein n=1 Tax=Asticcacaulis biprosthecium C19 TaxID=715226 RepID=F4QTU1_9CAUL|nr:hypothetical protein [Asticcacaulis biprosthecium]EGF89241.1 hypothetical protein ABI_45880 [Asticcacaulis biprosthecium C19]
MSLHSPESCASCNKVDCHLSFASRDMAPVLATTAWVLDEMWPEHQAYLTDRAREDDQILRPGVFGAATARYAWGRGQGVAGWATVLRHAAMKQVAKARGAVRQAAYLKADQAVAQAMAKRIDYRAQHVVVAQTLLPFLWRDGVLGGRSFDVLMTRYPLAEIHRRLDQMQAQHPDSTTIGDFRAPDSLLAAESAALAQARKVITPHHDIAESFQGRAVWLDWRNPELKLRRDGRRVAFIGPSITRQGAREVRELARGLPEPLIVFGADLEGAGFWDGVAIERRAFGPGWMDDLGAILHPAAMTAAPRRLVEAQAHGITVYAQASCGLAPGKFRPLETFQRP